MSTMTAPIVGAFFRRPALAIIANLPAGCPLTLTAEPDNPYSKNGCAIQVVILKENLPHGSEIEVACIAQGTFPEDLYARDWHLAYIAEATGENAIVFPKLAAVESCTLTFDAKGKPQAKIIFLD